MNKIKQLMLDIRQQLPGDVEKLNLILTRDNSLHVEILWNTEEHYKRVYSHQFLELSTHNQIVNEVVSNATQSYNCSTYNQAEFPE